MEVKEGRGFIFEGGLFSGEYGNIEAVFTAPAMVLEILFFEYCHTSPSIFFGDENEK